MSEYIISVSAEVIERAKNGETIRITPKLQEVVRCRDCKHYYEAENYHPSGNYVSRCCKYFDTYNDEVEPDGFCKWGERRDA